LHLLTLLWGQVLHFTFESAQYKAVIIWCESFSQFITAAQYR